MTKLSRDSVTSLMMSAFAVVLMLFDAPALGSTPDGKTPAEESVCDVLNDATPGLYGLCVAYCEAQDCDFEGARSGQCKAPNPKLLSRYDEMRSDHDPAMPCLLADAECPCFSAEDLHVLPIDKCEERDYGLVVNVLVIDESRQNGALVEMNFDDGTGRCLYLDESDPSAPPILSDAETDATQTQACMQIVEEYAAATNLDCEYQE